MNTIKKQFLTDTDNTGRFIVKSNRTGITYYVEPLSEGTKRSWGDLIPGKDGQGTEGNYGSKYRGSINKEDSLITSENGFKNIEILNPGVSPLGTIHELDEIRYNEGFRSKA